MADTDYKYDVFISYSSANKDWVRKDLLSALEKAGLKACIDFRDFQVGKPALKNMRDSILESRHTLLVLTEAYLNSGWTEFENLLAQTLDPANRQTRVVPMLREKCKLPLEISYLTYVNFCDPDDWDIAWAQLLTALGKSKEIGLLNRGQVKPKRAKKHKAKSEKLDEKKISGDYNTINTEYAISDFCEMLNPDSAKRIMHIWGDSMMGKSHLTEKVFPNIARNMYKNIIDSRIEFSGFEGDEIDLMCQIRALFPDPKLDCPSFTQQHEVFLSFLKKMSEATSNQSNEFDFKQQRSDHRNAMIVALVEDLRKHEDIKFVFLFDAVNNVPSGLRDWLLKKFIFHISQLKNVRIVITSKAQLDLSCVHSSLCVMHPLRSVQRIDPYVEYCQRHKMHMKIDEIQTIVYAARFNPGQFLILANEFKKSKEGLKYE